MYALYAALHTHVQFVIFRTPLINWMLIARLFLAQPKVVMDVFSTTTKAVFFFFSLSHTIAGGRRGSILS